MTMTNLNNRNEATASQIDNLLTQIEVMRQQLDDMAHQARQAQQIHKAQESLTKEWNNTTKSIAKHFKDACSVYGDPEAIDDMVEDIKAIALEVKDNFEDYQQSDRFLNQQTAEEQDEVETPDPSIPALPATFIPPEDNDEVVLSPEQIEAILTPLDEDIIRKVQTNMDISTKLKRLNSIAGAIAKRSSWTHFKLKRFIDAIQNQTLLLLG